MFVKHAIDYTPSLTEQHLMEQPRPRQRTTAGPVVKYQLESLRLDKPSAVRRGDVIVFVSADDEWIYAPAVVVSDAVRIPRSGGAVLYFLRIRADLPPLPLSDAAAALADLGHPGPRLQADHYVRSPTLRAALLALWDF